MTLEKILISLEMVGLFSLDISEGNDRNHILCLLLSGLGSVFHPNGDTRQLTTQIWATTVSSKLVSKYVG